MEIDSTRSSIRVAVLSFVFVLLADPVRLENYLLSPGFAVALTGLATAIILIAALIACLRRVPELIIVMRHQVWLFALVAMCLLSPLWSPYPDLSWQAALILLQWYLLALAIVIYVKPEELHRSICWSFVAILGLYLLGLLLPPGDHRGVPGAFGHKNIAGSLLASAAVFYLIELRFRPLLRNAAIVFACLLALYHTDSLSQMLVVFFMVLILSWHAGRRSRFVRPALLTIGAAGLVAVLLFAPSQSLLLSWLHRDDTFGDRLRFWPYLLDQAGERLFLGWGLDAFWTSRNPALNLLQEQIGLVLYHSHNGVLAVALSTGLTGVLLLALAWIKAVVSALRQKLHTSPVLAWIPVFLLLAIFIDLADSIALFRARRLQTLLFFIALVLSTSYSSLKRRDNDAEPSP